VRARDDDSHHKNSGNGKNNRVAGQLEREAENIELGRESVKAGLKQLGKVLDGMKLRQGAAASGGAGK
jgi:hypothetical protein